MSLSIKQFAMYVVISVMAVYFMTGVANALNGGYVEPGIAYYLVVFLLNFKIYRAVQKYYGKDKTTEDGAE